MQNSCVGSDSRERASPFDDPFSFDNHVDAVHSGQVNLFLCSAGPMDFDLVHLGGSSQTKMQSLIGARGVASTAEHIPALTKSAGCDKGLRSKRVAWAFRTTNQFKSYPVV